MPISAALGHADARADVAEDALRAERPPGDADVAPVADELHVQLVDEPVRHRALEERLRDDCVGPGRDEPEPDFLSTKVDFTT